MKYYKLSKDNGEVKEIKNHRLNLKPVKIYKDENCYYGAGEVCRKFLSVVAKAQNIEKYWDKVANNWVEAINQKKEV